MLLLIQTVLLNYHHILITCFFNLYNIFVFIDAMVMILSNTYICDNLYYTKTPNFEQQQNPCPSRRASYPQHMDQVTNILLMSYEANQILLV